MTIPLCRLALVAGVALPTFVAGQAPAVAQAVLVATAPIIVAQADGLAAAQAELEAAQAALRQAQESGGDVAAAQARLEAALSAVAAAQADTQIQPLVDPPAQAGAVSGQPAEPPSETEVKPPQPPEQAGQIPEETGRSLDAQEGASPETNPSQADAPQQERAVSVEEVPQTPSAEQNVEEMQAPATKEASPAQSEAPSVPTESAETPLPGEKQQPTVNEASPASGPPEAPRPPRRQDKRAGSDGASPSADGNAKRDQVPTEAAPAADNRQEQAAPSQKTDESVVESQLEAQGDKKAIENVRSLRRKLREELSGDQRERKAGQESSSTSGRQGDRQKSRRADDRDRREQSSEGDIVLDFGGGFIVEFGDQLVIRRDSAEESERFLDRARDVQVEHLDGGFTRTGITRRDGTKIYTVWTRDGDLLTRTRVRPSGRQTVLIDNRAYYRDGRRPRHVRFKDDLPPLRLGIPRDQYIVETSRVSRNEIRQALLAPPVEAVERPYALEEIRTSERLRDKVRRVDLNTITFDFGSATISPSQFEALSVVGGTLEAILANAPNEIFLIEGHTDAVGSSTDNLILSDRRAEAIAVALSSNFAIPPENLVTQGYGEQYLKVASQGPERENRRVTVRRITPLVAQGS